MKSCPKCLNLSPDTAVACQQCGTVLDDSIIARAGGLTGARTPTIVEMPGATRPAPPSLADFRPIPPPAQTAAPARASGRRGETVYMPPGQTVAPSAPRASERRIIGILVTWSWRPEGQVFPVREGRNLIGRGEECDIRLAEDSALSQVNSHITFRQNFVVGDMVSMGGTYLDDEPVEEQFRPLQNYAQIRTGSTTWTFIIVDPALISR